VAAPASALTEFAPGAIWLVDYPVRYAGTSFEARMSVIRLADGRLILHSPCDITPALKSAIEALGPVGWIVAPGTFHYLHLPSAQAAFPLAETWICPGLEAKRPDLAHDGLLGGEAPAEWAGQIDQQLVADNRIISEVVLLHRASRTLIVTDLIERFGDHTPRVGWLLRLYWKLFGMWNRPRPAPEYAIGWRDRAAAAEALEHILAWDFDRIVLAHGDLVAAGGPAVARAAWAPVLRHRRG